MFTTDHSEHFAGSKLAQGSMQRIQDFPGSSDLKLVSKVHPQHQPVSATWLGPFAMLVASRVCPYRFLWPADPSTTPKGYCTVTSVDDLLHSGRHGTFEEMRHLFVLFRDLPQIRRSSFRSAHSHGTITTRRGFIYTTQHLSCWSKWGCSDATCAAFFMNPVKRGF